MKCWRHTIYGVDNEMCDVNYQMWNVEYKIWDIERMRCGIQDIGYVIIQFTVWNMERGM